MPSFTSSQLKNTSKFLYTKLTKRGHPTRSGQSTIPLSTLMLGLLCDWFGQCNVEHSSHETQKKFQWTGMIWLGLQASAITRREGMIWLYMPFRMIIYSLWTLPAEAQGLEGDGIGARELWWWYRYAHYLDCNGFTDTFIGPYIILYSLNTYRFIAQLRYCKEFLDICSDF